MTNKDKLLYILAIISGISGTVWLISEIRLILILLLNRPQYREITIWCLSILPVLIVVSVPYYLPIMKNRVFIFLPQKNRSPEKTLKLNRIAYFALTALSLAVLLYFTGGIINR